MTSTKGYVAQNATTALAPFTFNRRDLKPYDVHIEIMYCGVCHSDVHQVRNEWGGTMYPIVPVHEIVGRVVKLEVIAMNEINEYYERMQKVMYVTGL